MTQEHRYVDGRVQCVAGIAISEDRVLLVRHPVLGDVAPGGKIGLDESAQEALEREILEETGLKLTRFGRLLYVDHQPKFDCYVYEMEVEPGEPKVGCEDVKAAWWGAPEEMLSGEIGARDYPYVVALMGGADG